MRRLALSWRAWLAWSAAWLMATALLVVGDPDSPFAVVTAFAMISSGSTGLIERRRALTTPPRKPVSIRTAGILCAVGFLVNVVTTVVVANNDASLEGPGALWSSWAYVFARYCIFRNFL